VSLAFEIVVATPLLAYGTLAKPKENGGEGITLVGSFLPFFVLFQIPLMIEP